MSTSKNNNNLDSESMAETELCRGKRGAAISVSIS